MAKGMKKRSSSKDGSFEDSKKSSKKKNAKDRKRELESMYGSHPVTSTQAKVESKRMSSSLPIDTSGEALKKSKHSKKMEGARAMDENEQSFAFHELVQRRPNISRAESKKKPSKPEQSFAVEELVEVRSPSKSPRPSKGANIGRGSIRGRSEHLQRENSKRPQMDRGRSIHRSGMLHSQHSSRPIIERSKSNTARTRSLSRASSSRRGRSLDRTGSGLGEGSTRRGLRPGISGQSSRPALRSQLSSRPALSTQMSRSRSMSRSRVGNMSGSVLYDGHATVAVITPGSARVPVNSGGRRGRNIRRFLPGKKIEEKPSRSIVVVWLIVAAELGFDLGTTIIAFQAFLEEDSCCGNAIMLG